MTAQLEPVGTGRNAPRPVRLDVARIRVPLILSLAIGEATQVELAAYYGVDQSAISRFADRYRSEIEAQRADLENELAALWIAQKAIRIGAYQEDVEQIDTYQEEMEICDAALLRVKHHALHAVAEELGQLKTVIDATVSVRYELVGVDPAALT